jgi:hypothetical protein
MRCTSRYILISLMLTAPFGFVQADSTLGSAFVTLVEPLSLAETQSVNFGIVANNNGRCSLTIDADLVGSQGHNCQGQGQLGEFQIVGTEDQLVSVAVAPGSAVQGLQFFPALATPTTASLTAGNATVLVYGDLDIQDANTGNHELNYVLTVNYN